MKKWRTIVTLVLAMAFLGVLLASAGSSPRRDRDHTSRSDRPTSFDRNNSAERFAHHRPAAKERPMRWRLMRSVDAPTMPVDPDAPVIDPATEAALIPLGSGDTDPTIDVQITQEIIDLANELDTPQAMYEFVRNEVEFQAYYGSRKGSAETLRQRAGNDYDQASLLIALLRAAGIPARYAEGEIEMTVAQAASWLGVDAGEVAGSILFTKGMEGLSIVSASTDCCVAHGTPGCDDSGIETCVCNIDPFCCDVQWDSQCVSQVDSFGCAVCADLTTVVAIRAQRVWVEGFVPRGFGSPAWAPLDPAFAQTIVQPGIDIPEQMGFDAQTFMDEYWDPTIPVPLPRPETPLDLFKQEIQGYLDANLPGTTVADVVRTQEIEEEALGLLPASLPYTVRAYDGAYSEIPSNRRYQIRFHLHNGPAMIDHTADLPTIAGRRVTISYVGATPGDQSTIDSFNGLLYTPPNLINLVPELRVDGQVVATGATPIGAGYTHDSDMHFLAPVNAGGMPQNAVPSIFNTIVAGELQAIGIAVHGAVNPLFDPEVVAPDGFIAMERYSKAMDYLERGIVANDELGQLMHAKVSGDISNAIVKDDILVTTDGLGNPTAWSWSGLTVDADRSVVGVWKVDEFESGCDGEGKEVLIVGGAEGSLAESLLFEEDYDQEAVSTIKILQLAVDQGITVYKRWNSLPLPPNTLSSSTQTAIQNSIAGGNEVTFPADPITYFNWTGTGYIDMDPCDGAAGYIISGGQNGGSTVDSWIDILWTNPDCPVECIQGRVITPAQDSPDSDSVFCNSDPNRLNFEYDLRADYDTSDPRCSQDFGSWTRRTHRSKSPKQLAPGHYELTVGDKGETGNDQHKRKLTVLEIELVTPAGNPVSAPNSTQGADGQNEFTFSAGGVLTIDFKAKTNPTSAALANAIKDDVLFTVESIGSSTMAWAGANPGGKASVSGSHLVAKATFTGLPAQNGDFGKKKTTVTCKGQKEDEETMEVFFRKNDGTPPNWFTYWKQALSALTSSTVDYRSIAGINGRTPAMRLWSPAMGYSKTEMWVSDSSAIFNTSPFNPGRRYGIDGMADTILHEDGHIVQISQADALVSTGNGIWAKGWSWNTGFPSAAYNHYTAGADGKPGAANVDDDNDGTTDETGDNSEYGFGDDVDLDTDHDSVPNSKEGVNPAWVEPYCRNLEQTTDNDHTSKDWGDPGKQHKTVDKYDD